MIRLGRLSDTTEKFVPQGCEGDEIEAADAAAADDFKFAVDAPGLADRLLIDEDCKGLAAIGCTKKRP
jgi:hypothetical protein